MNGAVLGGKKCSKNFLLSCFTLLMRRNRTASQRRFQTDDLIWMSPSLIDVCFLLLNYFLVTTTIVKKTEYLYATSFDLSAKCRLSAFCDRLG